MNHATSRKTTLILLLGFLIISEYHFTEKKTKAAFLGVPISQKFCEMENHVFHPQNIFIGAKGVLMIYDADQKLYALDEIGLADGVKPEELKNATNHETFFIYRDAHGKLLLRNAAFWF